MSCSLKPAKKNTCHSPNFSSAQVRPGSVVFGVSFYLGVCGAKRLPEVGPPRLSGRAAHFVENYACPRTSCLSVFFLKQEEMVMRSPGKRRIFLLLQNSLYCEYGILVPGMKKGAVMSQKNGEKCRSYRSVSGNSPGIGQPSEVGPSNIPGQCRIASFAASAGF